MWIMTPFGVLSAVNRPPKTVTDGKPLQIRARDEKALSYLRRNFMGKELGRTLRTPERDYRFRAYCTHEAFAAAVARMITEIDYENFKNAVPDDDLHDLYIKVWSTVFTHYERRTRPRRRNWWDE